MGVVQYNPRVTVLVTHHINDNDAYLCACIDSVLASQGIDIEVIAISDAALPPKVQNDPRLQLIWDGKHVTCADKWKEALRVGSPEAKLFMMINDDVMISKNLIRRMAQVMGDGKAIIGALSNCDNGSRYFSPIPFPRKHTLEALGDHKQVIDYPDGPAILLPQNWIGFYCVMMPKVVIEQVGELDQGLEVRGNDVDYCFRAKRLGIPSLIHLGVYAHHFGDRTIPKVTTQDQYDAADQAMRDKYRIL